MRLHRTDVLAGALDQLDRVGLDGLTMQALATALGVRPGALYWHYADKAALIDAMAETIASSIDLDGTESGPWQGRVLLIAEALRSALRSRRDGARLVSGTFIAQPHTLRTGLALTQAIEDAGLSAHEATTAAFSIFYFILGYVIEEQARSAPDSAERWNAYQDQIRDTAPPDIAAAIAEIPNTDTFATGMQMLIAGILARLAAAPQDRPPA